MGGLAPCFSNYGVPPPYYPMQYQGRGLPMPEPARHSMSSLPGFHGGPYTLPRPYSEGSSRAARHNFAQGTPPWQAGNMGDDDMASAAPGSAQHVFGQQHFAPPVHDVETKDHSMPSAPGGNNSSSVSIPFLFELY
ncbi:unnamed protein product [Urochloa humidicola]